MQDYRNLRVWQKAHQLGVNAYALPAYLSEPKGWALRDLLLGHDVQLIPQDLLTRLGNEVSDVRQLLTRLIQTVDPKSPARSR